MREETRCLRYSFGGTPGRRTIWSEVQRTASWFCPNDWFNRARTDCHFGLRLLCFIPRLDNSRHSGLHTACFENARLSLKVASRLHFQAFVGALRDTRAAAECLFKTCAEPVGEKKKRYLIFLCTHTHCVTNRTEDRKHTVQRFSCELFAEQSRIFIFTSCFNSFNLTGKLRGTWLSADCCQLEKHVMQG